MGVNYGANRLRFPAPVPWSSKVRAGVELLSVTASGRGHEVIARVTIERENGDKTQSAWSRPSRSWWPDGRVPHSR